MSDLQGRVVLVTGATDGLGRGVAESLARDGATVLVHGRDKRKLDSTLADIESATGNPNLCGYLADFSSLTQVREMATAIRDEHAALHLFVSNAGVGYLPERHVNQDGYELTFAVNYLAGFLLTQELLPLLQPPARIVYVASIGQHPIDFDDLMIERNYSGQRAYGQSKLSQIMSGFELAAELDAGEVTVNSLHPSTLMPTKLVMESFGRSVDTLARGVAATVRLAADPALDGVSGKFFDREREGRPDQQAYDASARRQLWEASLELTRA